MRTIQTTTAHYNKGSVSTRYNRTGATLVEGAVGFIDAAQGDGDSGSVEAGLDNVVAISTARIAIQPRLVVAAGVPNFAADNERGQFIEGDGVECLILVESTTDIAAGDWLKPVNAQVYMVKGNIGAIIDNTGSSGTYDYVYAQALQARTADSAGLIRCLLYSGGKRG